MSSETAEFDVQDRLLPRREYLKEAIGVASVVAVGLAAAIATWRPIANPPSADVLALLAPARRELAVARHEAKRVATRDNKKRLKESRQNQARKERKQRRHRREAARAERQRDR